MCRNRVLEGNLGFRGLEPPRNAEALNPKPFGFSYYLLLLLATTARHLRIPTAHLPLPTYSVLSATFYFLLLPSYYLLSTD